MPTSNMKKIILIIVEGRSDEAYLSPIKRMVKSRSNNKIEFKVTKGDILVQNDADSTNIEIKVGLAVQEYLNLYRLEYDDVKQIVHVVDFDGAFVDTKQIETDITLNKGQTIYYRDKIINLNKNNIIRRNKKKTASLEVLYNLDEINYGTQGTIPYRVYYFSTNIDDYFFGEQNLTDEEKERYSNFIYDRYIDNCEEYRNAIERDFCVPGNYIETWQYVKIDNNSLSRCTNFNKFFTEIIDKL